MNERRGEFDWQPQPEAARLVDELLARFVAASSDIALLAQRLRDETGTRLVDWTCELSVAQGAVDPNSLEKCGFEKSDDERGQVWRHARGLFPAIIVNAGDSSVDNLRYLRIKVEAAGDFAAAWKKQFTGELFPPLPRDMTVCEVSSEGAPTIFAESRGVTELSAKHLTELNHRKREFDTPAEGFELVTELHAAAAADLDAVWATDLFFAAERSYWMNRNSAARVQYERQQTLGLGWANHDHHTYRSSRPCFHLLIQTLEKLGFTCRERFYAGREAGWGAQVLEHVWTGVVIFADVDLSPEEVAEDFAHQPLAARETLGTVGLWCQLHGEAFLEAGMHHLECQFDFDAAREQLAAAGVETMAPFTDFPYLKQAFTSGERWPVAEERLQAAERRGLITAEQAENFRSEGAIGSHLEILERNDGYKGFNQTGISEIITRTDPRKC